MEKLGVVIDIGAAKAGADLDKLLKGVKSLEVAFTKAEGVAKIFGRTLSDNLGGVAVRASNEAQKAFQKVRQETLTTQQVQERAAKASADATARYAKLKADYETKSLDEIRAKIMSHEESIRADRQARSIETNAQVKKALQEQINIKNAELQQFRSLEKEKTGRTFTEILERLNLEKKSTRDVRAVFAQSVSERERLERALTKTTDAEVTKRLQFELDAARKTEAAAKEELTARKQNTFSGAFTGNLKSMSPALSGGGGMNMKAALGNSAAAAASMALPGGALTSGLSMMGPHGMAIAAGAAAATIAIKGAIEVGTKYQNALADMSAITGLVGEDLNRLGDNARELAVKWGVSADDAVEASKMLVSALGPEIAKNAPAMKSMTDNVLMLSKAAGIDAQTAAKGLITAMGQFDLSTLSASEQAEHMTRIMELLANGSQIGNAEVADLAEGMKVVGSVAHDSKISMSETAAALEVLAKAEIKGSEGGTMFRNAILNMSAGTKASQDALDSIGISFDQINPEKVGLKAGLENLKVAFDKITDPVKRASVAQSLFGERGVAGANILMANTELLGEYTAAMDKQGTASEQAGKNMSTLSGQWDVFKQGVSDMAITLFNVLEPAFNMIMSSMRDLMPLFKLLGGWMGGSFVAAVYAVAVPLKLLSATFKFLWDLVSGLVTKFGEWLGTIAPLRAAFEGIKETIASVVSWIKDLWSTVTGFFSSVSEWATGSSSASSKPAPKYHGQGTGPVAVVPEMINPKEILKPGPAAAYTPPVDAKAADKARKEALEKALKANETLYTQERLAAIGRRLAGQIDEEEYQKSLTQIEIDELIARKGILTKFKEDTAAIQLEIQQKHLDAQEKADEASLGRAKKEFVEIGKAGVEELEAQKKRKEELLQQEKDLQDTKVALMVEGIDKQLAAEDLRYQRARELIAGNLALEFALYQEHEQKRLAITKQGTEGQQRIMQFSAEQFGNVAGIINTNFFQPLTAKWAEQGGVAGQVMASITQGVIKMGTDLLIQQAMNFVQQQVFTTASTATTTAAMAAINAAAIPAATAASIASFGGASIAGSSAMIAALGATEAAYTVAQMLADGGVVEPRSGLFRGIGGPKDDKNLVALSDKEFIVNAKSTSEWLPVLHAINSGNVRRRALGTPPRDESLHLASTSDETIAAPGKRFNPFGYSLHLASTSDETIAARSKRFNPYGYSLHLASTSDETLFGGKRGGMQIDRTGILVSQLTAQNAMLVNEIRGLKGAIARQRLVMPSDTMNIAMAQRVRANAEYEQ